VSLPLTKPVLLYSGDTTCLQSEVQILAFSYLIIAWIMLLSLHCLVSIANVLLAAACRLEKYDIETVIIVVHVIFNCDELSQVPRMKVEECWLYLKCLY
jgi:hypothetical protein